MSRKGKRNFEACQLKRVVKVAMTARLNCAVTGPEGIEQAAPDSAATTLKEYAAAHLCGQCAFAGMAPSTFNQLRIDEANLETERLEAELRLIEVRRKVAEAAAELRSLQIAAMTPALPEAVAPAPATAPPPQEAPVTPPPPAIEGS